MPGVFDLLNWVASAVGPPEDDDGPSEAEVAEMAAGARGDTVTPAVLANRDERSDAPIAAYMEDGEQPEYVLRGNKLLISDGSDAVSRNYPTRETQVVISDERVLFVLGGRIGDEVWEVPLGDVTQAYVDDEELDTRYVVVEADRDDNPMTFFADVTLESDVDDVESGVEYVASHAE